MLLLVACSLDQELPHFSRRPFLSIATLAGFETVWKTPPVLPASFLAHAASNLSRRAR